MTRKYNTTTTTTTTTTTIQLIAMQLNNTIILKYSDSVIAIKFIFIMSCNC